MIGGSAHCYTCTPKAMLRAVGDEKRCSSVLQEQVCYIALVYSCLMNMLYLLDWFLEDTTLFFVHWCTTAETDTELAPLIVNTGISCVAVEPLDVLRISEKSKHYCLTTLVWLKICNHFSFKWKKNNTKMSGDGSWGSFLIKQTQLKSNLV